MAYFMVSLEYKQSQLTHGSGQSQTDGQTDRPTDRPTDSTATCSREDDSVFYSDSH